MLATDWETGLDLKVWERQEEDIDVETERETERQRASKQDNELDTETHTHTLTQTQSKTDRKMQFPLFFFSFFFSIHACSPPRCLSLCCVRAHYHSCSGSFFLFCLPFLSGLCQNMSHTSPFFVCRVLPLLWVSCAWFIISFSVFMMINVWISMSISDSKCLRLHLLLSLRDMSDVDCQYAIYRIRIVRLHR